MDLLETVQLGQQKVRDLMHSGIKPEHIEMIALNSLCDEILQDIGKIERYDDVKKAMLNIYFFGQIFYNEFR